MPNFSIPLSGLTAESTALSTIANNLSNQNTTGYKDKVVLFSDLFYQSLGTTGSGRSHPGRSRNSSRRDCLPCSLRAASARPEFPPTWPSRATGFFVVQDSNGVISYTRAGRFF